MAVRITGIAPKPTKPIADSIAAHLAINEFKWINEQSLTEGITTRSSMFDWIVNSNGKAYIKKDDEVVKVLGVDTPTGKYIRATVEGKWTNDLLDIPEIS